MKLKKIRIKNFRGYDREIDVSIGDVTVFAGKNDAGKSVVLEALDIFSKDDGSFNRM